MMTKRKPWLPRVSGLPCLCLPWRECAEEFVRAARDFLDQERQRRRVALAMRRGGRLWTMKTWLGEQCHASRADARGE